MAIRFVTGVDIGTRNMGLVCVSLRTQRVVRWEHVDLKAWFERLGGRLRGARGTIPEPDTVRLVSRYMRARQREFFSREHFLVVENQAGQSGKDGRPINRAQQLVQHVLQSVKEYTRSGSTHAIAPSSVHRHFGHDPKSLETMEPRITRMKKGAIRRLQKELAVREAARIPGGSFEGLDASLDADHLADGLLGALTWIDKHQKADLRKLAQ